MTTDAFTPFRKILVATDFSDAARVAVVHGIKLCELLGGQITVAHVLTHLRQTIADLPYASRCELLFGDIDQFERAIRAGSQTQLHALVDSFRANCPYIATETLLGKPVFALINAVQSEGHDVVIVGSHGRSRTQQWLMGSTTRQLVRECPAAVWVTKGGSVWPPARLLVAVDFSDLSRRAFDHAAHLTKSLGATLDVLHVIEMSDVLSEVHPSERTSLRDTAIGHDIQEQARGQLAQWIKATGLPSDQVEIHVEWGTAQEVIVEASQSWNSDLIVLGTFGRSGFQGYIVGNTAEQVLQRSECSVLTIKPVAFVSRVLPPAWELHPAENTLSEPCGVGSTSKS